MRVDERRLTIGIVPEAGIGLEERPRRSFHWGRCFCFLMRIDVCCLCTATAIIAAGAIVFFEIANIKPYSGKGQNEITIIADPNQPTFEKFISGGFALILALFAAFSVGYGCYKAIKTGYGVDANEDGRVIIL